MGRERRTYLLGGRRVAVSDLLDSGLVEVGQELTFHRPRVRQTHSATVEAKGSLLMAGRSYATPSAAACAAAGLTQMDGWTAWATDDGITLHRLRAQLLDSIADDADSEGEQDDEKLYAPPDPEAESLDDSDPNESASALVPRHVFLKQARQAAESGTPVTLSVRLLLARWGGRARGHRISRRIQVDLDNHGLVTRPNFLRVSLDDDVSLESIDPSSTVDADEPVIAPSAVAPVVVGGTAGVADTADQPGIGMTLGNLTSPERRLVSVKSTASFAEAMTLMLMNDYSQLAVIDDETVCCGAVTWKSIAYSQLKDADAGLSAAVVPVAVRSYDDDLHHLLPLLQAEQFIVVADSHGKMTGIVTTADVVGLYGDRTLPFLLIGELDQELRRLMTDVAIEKIQEICGKSGQKPKSHDDMTMFQYVTVLRHPDCWDALGWPLDRQAFVTQLDMLRKVRNDVMHFNPDGVPEGTVDKLRHMLALIREFGPPGSA